MCVCVCVCMCMYVVLMYACDHAINISGGLNGKVELPWFFTLTKVHVMMNFGSIWLPTSVIDGH